MILLDANILLYAHVEGLPQFSVVSKWLEDQLSNKVESTALAWIGITAFVRISTNIRIFEKPWTAKEASDRVDLLLAHPKVQIVNPTANHWKSYSKLLREFNLSGDIVMDAHIAALAIEHNASVATTDKDFRRFSDYIKLIDPYSS